MPTIALLSMNGDKVGEMELKAEVFGVEANLILLHQAVIEELANQRSGTAATKTRGFVRGGGRKPYRQKGTGRARQGSIRAPHYPGGGVVWGPHPRSYAQSMPRKMRRAALRSALSAKFADGEIMVLDDITLSEISTKKMAAVLSKLGVGEMRVMLAVTQVSEELVKSSRNIPGIALRIAPALSVAEVLDSDRVILTRAAATRLEEAYA